MNDKLMKHLEKKGKKLKSPLEKQAKMDVLGELSKQAGSMMGDKIRGLKKVTVASNDKEGLEEGLEKAKELIGKHDPDSKIEQAEEELHEDLDHDNEEGESEEHKEKVLGEESEGMSLEEIQKKIEELSMLAKKMEQK